MWFSLIILLMICLMLWGERISGLLQQMLRPISAQYAVYLGRQLTGKTNADFVSWSNIIIHSLLIIHSTIIIARTRRRDYETTNILFISVIGILMRVWSMKFPLAVRFAYYFDVFLLLYVPKAYMTKKGGFRLVNLMGDILLCLSFWMFFYMYKNNLNTAVFVLR